MWILLLDLALAADLPGPDPSWGAAGLPALSFSTDEGLGLGVVGSVYRYDGRTDPYRSSVDLTVYATTIGVHYHAVEADLLRVAGSPWRLTVRGELQASRTSNYCGVGNGVTCDQTGAVHYNQLRFVYPNSRVDARYELDPMPHRLEVVLGHRLSYLIPGTFTESTPYAGSRYATEHPTGEPPWTSVLQAGLMLDDRDHEPAPTRGYWVEATVRGAHGLWGSSADYAGANVTARTYLPLGTRRLVLAQRQLVDAIVGDANALELATPGGTQQVQFFGDATAGRGIRQRRYLGRLKSMEQAELRWVPIDTHVGEVGLSVGGLGFVDVGFVGVDGSELGSMWSRPLVGTGGGLRIGVDDSFIVRADVGVSPVEGYEPFVYLDVGNLF